MFYNYPDPLNLDAQAVLTPTGKQGESGIYSCALWDRSALTSPDKPKSLFEIQERAIEEHPNRAIFAYRPILTSATPSSPAVLGTTLVPIKYSTAQQRRNAVGSALLDLERTGRLKAPKLATSLVTPVEITFPNIPHYGRSNRAKNGARRGWGVGLWSKNRYEWQLVDMACQCYGLVSISLYDTLGPDVATYITNHGDLSVIFAEAGKVSSLLKMAPMCPSLRVIICMDPLTPAERQVYQQWASSVDVELLTFEEFEARGYEEGVKCPAGPVRGIAGEEELDRQRIVTVSYTSGTTGDPKGVVLTNFNFTTAVISNSHGEPPFELRAWRYISILPLSHIYARFSELVTVHSNGTICYTSGDPTRLLEDAAIIKPDFLAGVPRIYNRIHAAVTTQMNAGGLKGALLRRAVDAKLKNWRENGEVKHRVWDALVFRKIRNLLGGEVRFISSGAAPLGANVHELLKICFSCEVTQGTGMTESVGTTAKGVPWDVGAVGTCGFIQPCNDVKLIDVPEMGYTSSDKPNPRGEMCLKGTNITCGYLHDPINTAKTIDKDGWLHTGDIAEIDSCGRVKIVDRVKNVVKLSQGEYVALEKIEGIYSLDPIHATLMVYADSNKSSLVAVSVLDPIQAAELVSSVLGKSIKPGDLKALEEAVQDKRVRKAVVSRFQKAAKQAKLQGFEVVKGVHLTVQPFPDAVMTPTLKVKRAQAAKHFRDAIERAYVDAESGMKEDKMMAKL